MNVTADFQSRALNGSAEWRLDPSVFQAILQTVHGGSICVTAERPVGTANGSGLHDMYYSDRCTTGAVDQPARVRFPSILPDRQVPAEGREGTGNSAADSSSVASPNMVSSSAGGIDRHTHTTSEITRPPHRPIRPATPTGQLPAIGRMEGVRERLASAGVSGQAAQLITSAWAKWQCWCMQRDLDPFSCNVSSLVNFLALLFNQGLQHRTINTVRSAVLVTHDQVEGAPIGQHLVVTRLMKGVYNSRPPEPRYSSSWRVERVTSHMRQMGSNNSLSLKQLSLKLVMLMALVEASRTSELAALDLRFRVFSPDGVTFRLPTLTKKRKAGAPPREIFFGGFPPDDRLCVISCLRKYEEKTREYRIQASDAPNKLFLSYVRPHRLVSSQRIANWIKSMLGDAGIDTGTFSAHSTRGASTTAAVKQGVPISQILRTADWSSEGTFREYILLQADE